MTAVAALWLGITVGAGLWPFAGRDGDKGPDVRETIGAIRKVPLDLNTITPVVDGSERAMSEYRRFLALGTGPQDMRAEAMRRLADLNMEAGVAAEADAERTGAGRAYFAEAVQLYEALLAGALESVDRDVVLYQLSRALEGAGRADDALLTLDRLVSDHPATGRADEAQFRRGETYFVRQDYSRAEEAYAAVVAGGDTSPFYEQSLYKQGWALFKQGRHDESLAPFLAVLERRLGPAGGDVPALVEAMSRPEQELLDDTLRVASITFSYLDGAESIAGVLDRHGDRDWSYLLYQSLGDLYLDKERFRDAAETYEAFVARDPVDVQAPQLQQAAIDAYMKGQFPSLVLAAKRRYVERYGLDAPYWQGRLVTAPAGAAVVAQLKIHLSDLAAHDHALAQASGAPADYEQAAGWYRRYLSYFPEDPDSASRSFLLGELYFEALRFVEARDAYLQAAYAYGSHAQAAEAGYAALLASREHEKALQGDARVAWHAAYIDQALVFADTFPGHPEAAVVQTSVAEDLFASGQPERAIEVAGLVVSRVPPASTDIERVAWTVLAHARFDLGRFAEAEQSYVRLRGYELPETQRAEVDTRVAASIYRQAEQARDGGDVDAAVGNFLRIASAVPASDIRQQALFDAATLLLNNERWGESVGLLQQFRREFPAHEYNADVTIKLALALREDGQSGPAAAEYERMADAGGEAELRRTALWQAAGLWRVAGRSTDEARVYARIVEHFPEPVAEAQEARQKLADLAADHGDWVGRKTWLEAIVRADGTAGSARDDRSRYLAARASIEMARPLRDAFNIAPLGMPLEQSLQIKTRRMEQALEAYAAAAAYGVAEVSTAATFETAELYYQLSRDLLASERPAGLDEEELEQYELLLEEQAFPFEEQAIELYQVNVARAVEGVWDEWIRVSYARLAQMVPARYARAEGREDVVTWLD